MELLVLGCHAGMPTEGRASSGYLVATDACRILLDCGPGVATALSARGGAGSLDAIVVSHLHPDHCFDLLPIGTTRLRLAGAAPLPLYVPRGARTLVDNLARLFPLRGESELGTPFHHAFAVVEYEPGAVFEVGDCAVSLHGLRHAVPNCGTRIRNATATVAYTGDTGPTEALLPLAEGADLLLAEATLAEPDPGDYGHLSASEAGRIAALAGVSQLVLTHLGSPDPGWAQARRLEAMREFPGTVHIAQPGETYPVRMA